VVLQQEVSLISSRTEMGLLLSMIWHTQGETQQEQSEQKN